MRSTAEAMIVGLNIVETVAIDCVSVRTFFIVAVFGVADRLGPSTPIRAGIKSCSLPTVSWACTPKGV